MSPPNLIDNENDALINAAIPLSDIAMPVIIVGKNRKIVDINSRAAFLFGWDSPASLIGLDLHVLLPVAKRKAHGLAFTEWWKSPSARNMAGPNALIEGRCRNGTKLGLKVALQWLPEQKLGVALIQSVSTTSVSWWRKPKAVIGLLFLIVGSILELQEVGFADQLLGAAFGMLIALSGKGESGNKNPE
jgi:hypothetical protein